MAESNSARSEILARIRKVASAEATGPSREIERKNISRRFHIGGALTSAERRELFTERLQDYGAGVYRASPGDLREVISKVLLQRGKKTIVVPDAWPEAWTPSGVEVLHDHGFTYAALDQSEGVMTACSVAIALTGTIVLQAGPLEGRRALTLIPDYYLCLVREDQIVELVPEAVEKLHASSTRPLTLISGPSATADIEMIRVQGVHGPRVLDVVIFD